MKYLCFFCCDMNIIDSIVLLIVNPKYKSSEDDSNGCVAVSVCVVWCKAECWCWCAAGCLASSGTTRHNTTHHQHQCQQPEVQVLLLLHQNTRQLLQTSHTAPTTLWDIDIGHLTTLLLLLNCSLIKWISSRIASDCVLNYNEAGYRVFLAQNHSWTGKYLAIRCVRLLSQVNSMSAHAQWYCPLPSSSSI